MQAINESLDCLSNFPSIEREPEQTRLPQPGRRPLGFGFDPGWTRLGQSCRLGR